MKRLSTLFFPQKNKIQRISKEQSPEPEVLFPLSQRVCFSSIYYNSHPLIWEFDPFKKTLICTFELAGSSVHYEKNQLLDYLAQIEGVTVCRENQSAIIDDVNHFRRLHHAMNIAESLELPKKAEEKSSTNNAKQIAKPPILRTIDEIFFPQISFAGHPFTWFYYRNHDLAIWTGKLQGLPKHSYSLDTLHKRLSSIPGIHIENEEAIIKEVGDFCLQHQMQRMSDENDEKLQATLSRT